MLAYRHINASWLSVVALCRAPFFGRADTLTGIAALECRGNRDAATVPGDAPSPAHVRTGLPHYSHQSLLYPRFLAPRLRW